MEEIAAPFLPEYRPCYLVGFISVIGQVLLLIAFVRDPQKCFRNLATYLLANVAVSDLTVLAYRPFRVATSNVKLPDGSVSWPKWKLEVILRLGRK